MKKVCSYILLVTLVVNLFAIGVVFGQASEKVPVIIKFNGKPDAGLVRGFGGDVKVEYTIIPAIACSLPEQAIAALKQNPKIACVEMDFEVQALVEDVPWGVSHIGADLVQSGGNMGDGVKIAILDSGIDYSHNDLIANYVGGFDFINNDDDPKDDNGHGTHCAGIVAASNDGAGIVGVAPEADLYAVKVLDRRGKGSYSGIISGLQWCIDNGIQIASMSLGGSSDSVLLEDACVAASEAGVVLVASSGNNGDGDPTDTELNYPAAYASVIAVGAIDESDVVASWSNSGWYLDVAAPGVSVYSTLPTYRVTLSKYGYDYGYLSGTSMACPHVSGVVALMIKSGLAASEVRSVLHDTADDIGADGFDYSYGYGVVDAVEAAGVGEPDTVSPVISGVEVLDVTLSSATITWNTDEVSDSRVNYGLDENLGASEFDSNKVTSHTVTLTGLASDSTYYFEVESADYSGNVAVDGLYTFATLAPDLDPPSQVLNLGAWVVSDSQIDLSWDLNSEGDLAYYNVYRDGVVIATRTDNSYSDTGLFALTSYVYEVSAVDTSENEGLLSEAVSTTTLDAPEFVVDTSNPVVQSRLAGKNEFFWATVTVSVTLGGDPVQGATVYAHWEGATSDEEIGTTDYEGFVVFTSDSVKNDATATFSLVIDKVLLP